MTLFEYLAIAFSLVFSFSAMRLLGGLAHAVQRGRRYWVHVSFACWQLAGTVATFWIFWSYRDVTWNFPTFLLVLANPGLLYFNACTLIPENPSAVEAWREYYYSVRRRYFVGVSCWGLAIAASATLALQMPWSHPARPIHLAILLIGVVGAASASHRVHAAIALFSLLALLFGMLTQGLRPGSFAP